MDGVSIFFYLTATPPYSWISQTEFSAGHAKRVIGSGVVLERKASISGTIPELKNKVLLTWHLLISIVYLALFIEV